MDTHTIEFDEPRRMAVRHESFSDDGHGDSGQWVEHTDTVEATKITYTEEYIVFERPADNAAMLVNRTEFFSAWTEGI